MLMKSELSMAVYIYIYIYIKNDKFEYKESHAYVGD